MKRIFLLFSFLLSLPLFAHSQEQVEESSRSAIGISSTFIGKGNIISIPGVDGAAGYSGDNYYTIAINYLYRINRVFQIETGMEYGKYHFIVSPSSSIPPPYDDYTYPIETYLLSIPITVRINFERFFFFNAGFSIDFDANDNYYAAQDQGGIGFLMGFGFNYELKSGLSFFANPYLQMHHVIDFEKGNNAQKLTKAGIRIGATYTFHK